MSAQRVSYGRLLTLAEGHGTSAIYEYVTQGLTEVEQECDALVAEVLADVKQEREALAAQITALRGYLEDYEAKFGPLDDLRLAVTAMARALDLDFQK